METPGPGGREKKKNGYAEAQRRRGAREEIAREEEEIAMEEIDAKEESES